MGSEPANIKYYFTDYKKVTDKVLQLAAEYLGLYERQASIF